MRLDFSWSPAAWAERGCCWHQSVAVLAWNHDNFSDNYFPWCPNLRSFKRLVNSLKEEYDEDYGKPEGEKQHQKDNHYSVHRSPILATHDCPADDLFKDEIIIYEAELSKHG